MLGKYSELCEGTSGRSTDSEQLHLYSNESEHVYYLKRTEVRIVLLFISTRGSLLLIIIFIYIEQSEHYYIVLGHLVNYYYIINSYSVVLKE
jgi:hypothetical protein